MKTQKERFRAFLKSPYTAAFLRCYVGFGLAASIATVLVMILTSVLFAVVGQKIQISPVAATVIYVAAFSAAPIGAAFLALRKHIRDKDCPLAWVRLFGLLTLLAVICASIDLLRLGASGKLGRLMITSLLVFPMFPLSGVFSFFGSPEIGLIISCAWPLLLFLLSLRFSGIRVRPAAALAAILLLLGAGALDLHLYHEIPRIKYAGHGFDYMCGYSSTDFSAYYPCSEPSMLTVPEDVPFLIEKKEDMPRLDGAEACYPLYAGLAKSCYRDIAAIEQARLDEIGDRAYNGDVVRMTNTIWAFQRLLDGATDLIFGARLSENQLSQAEKMGVEIEQIPIGREAFVFFVEKDNPVQGLTSAQLRKIYSGEIRNWAELGGRDQEIVAFQRPANSGSQTMMLYFMGDTPLQEPMTYESVGGMLEVIESVAEYANEGGAIGYTFRYFLEELNQVKGVRILAVDGVLPSPQTIRDGSYPLTVGLYCIARADRTNPNIQRLIDYLLSPEGQRYIEQVGYGPLQEN